MSTVTQTAWLFARLDDVLGSVPDGFRTRLTDAERAELDVCRHAGRRDQWLAGRWLSRRLLQQQGIVPSAAAVNVQILSRDAAGRAVRPEVSIDGRLADCQLSITHTSTAVLAAIGRSPVVTLGADLVQKAELGPHFQAAWFDESERASIAGGDPWEAGRLWAAKEAVYKAVQNGESFAPRRVSLRRDENRGYRCAYYGLDLADRCRIATWICDNHLAALVTFDRSGDAADSNSTASWQLVPRGVQDAPDLFLAHQPG